MQMRFMETPTFSKQHHYRVLTQITVNLVEEDDGRPHLVGLIEEKSQLAFGFADPFRQTIGALAHEKRHASLCIILYDGKIGFEHLKY